MKLKNSRSDSISVVLTPSKDVFFTPAKYHVCVLKNPGRFGPGSFRPGSFRPGSFRPNLGVGRFGLGRWVDSALGRFGPGSFRPKIDR